MVSRSGYLNIYAYAHLMTIPKIQASLNENSASLSYKEDHKIIGSYLFGPTRSVSSGRIRMQVIAVVDDLMSYATTRGLNEAYSLNVIIDRIGHRIPRASIKRVAESLESRIETDVRIEYEGARVSIRTQPPYYISLARTH